MKYKSATALLIAAAATPAVIAGPVGYAICQTGCNTVAVACYGAAGLTFGVALPVAPPAIIACNGALGVCMAACAAVALVPTP